MEYVEGPIGSLVLVAGGHLGSPHETGSGLHAAKAVTLCSNRQKERTMVSSESLSSRPARLGALGRLLHPIEPEEFVQEHWGKKPLLVKGHPDKFASII